jgi:membrane-bound lytic murein transglycosylase MltF
VQSWKKLALLLVTGFALQAMAAEVAILHNGFSILHTRREVVGDVTRLYTGANGSYVDIATEQIDHFEHDATPAVIAPGATPKPAQNLDQVISAISDRHHIDPDFINSVIHAESGFNQHAVSPKGAQGLMQLMPGTAIQLGVTDAFDAGDNVEGGTRYLRELLERYNFDVIKALAAYNAGPGRVERYRGVPPYAETRAYVARIIRDYNRKKLAEKKSAAAEKLKASKHVGSSVKQAAISPPSH